MGETYENAHENCKRSGSGEISNTCENCGYFRQHYIWRQGFAPIECGHCVHPPRTRRCRPGMAACEKWIPQDDEYRTVYLLQE